MNDVGEVNYAKDIVGVIHAQGLPKLFTLSINVSLGHSPGAPQDKIAIT